MDYSVRPLVAAVPYKHAGDGFTLCEFTQTILKQNNNQLLNDCGSAGVLSALVTKSPVEAFKQALQLYYTGSLPGMDITPCPYVFEQQPGLIPFAQGQPGYDAFPAGTNFCPGVAVQEEGAASNECQNVDIHQMWITATLDVYEQKMRLQAGLDNGCKRKLYQSLHPLEDTTEAQLTRASMVVGNAAVASICEMVFTGACTFLSPAIQRCAQELSISQEACSALLTAEDVAPSDMAVLVEKLPQVGLDELAKFISETPTLNRWATRLPGTSWVEKASHVVTVSTIASTPSADAQATAAIMEKACTSTASILYVHTNMLKIAQWLNQGTAMQDALLHAQQHGITPGGDCNHFITLTNCDDAAYHIWSWGQNFPVQKDFFHQGVCGAVVNG